MNFLSAWRTVSRRTVRGVRLARDKILCNLSRLLKREHVPESVKIYIEPSSVCNLACRFCGYSKIKSRGVVMDNERFRDSVTQATELGFTKFQLTPLVGEVFVDKHFLEKLRFLDEHPGVKWYGFFTNFTLPDAETVAALLDLRKFHSMTVSLYGHDRESFRAITQGGERFYDRLVENLRILESRISDVRFELELGWRTEQSYNHWRPKAPSELSEVVARLRKTHGVRVRISRDYTNWGGLITQEDLDGLDIRIGGTDDVYKNGACSLIFSRMIIGADGRVNACACRDADTTLVIGDLNRRPLREIISSRNKKYTALIESQQAGRFSAVCRDCDQYKSILRKRSRARHLTLAEYYRKIDR